MARDYTPLCRPTWPPVSTSDAARCTTQQGTGTTSAPSSVEAGKDTARAIAGAELLLFEGMGHDLPDVLWPRMVDAVGAVAARKSPELRHPALRLEGARSLAHRGRIAEARAILLPFAAEPAGRAFLDGLPGHFPQNGASEPDPR